ASRSIAAARPRASWVTCRRYPPGVDESTCVRCADGMLRALSPAASGPLGGLVADAAPGGHRLDQPRVPAHTGARTDARLGTGNGGPRIDGDVVLDRRMPLASGLAGDAARHAEGAQRHPLVHLDVVPDHAGLADHHARPVVDEERLADLRPRM